MKYTQQEIQFIRDNWQRMSDKEIAQRLGRKAGGVKNARHKMGLTRHTKKPWTPQEDEILKKHYPTKKTEELLPLLPGRNVQGIYNRVDLLGIKKDPEFLYQMNRELGLKMVESQAFKSKRFKKGHKSWNKGKNPKDYMSPEKYARIARTQFKKGQDPHNTKWDGAISVRTDTGTGLKYLYIRLAKAEWELLHRHLWRKHKGEIPEGHIVTFRDGNTMNVSLENLELISMADNARRNQNWRKAMKTMMRKGNHPSHHLTDNFIISLVSRGDEDIKDYMRNNPGLIEVIRANYKLRRIIDEAV